MILQNKTSQFQNIEGQSVRPYRTVIVADDVDFNERIFEILYQNKSIKKSKNKKIKGD